MESQNFTGTFAVDQSPQEDFASINDVHGWWSENIDGITELSDERADATPGADNQHQGR